MPPVAGEWPTVSQQYNVGRQPTEHPLQVPRLRLLRPVLPGCLEGQVEGETFFHRLVLRRLLAVLKRSAKTHIVVECDLRFDAGPRMRPLTERYFAREFVLKLF